MLLPAVDVATSDMWPTANDAFLLAAEKRITAWLVAELDKSALSAKQGML